MTDQELMNKIHRAAHAYHTALCTAAALDSIIWVGLGTITAQARNYSLEKWIIAWAEAQEKNNG